MINKKTRLIIFPCRYISRLVFSSAYLISILDINKHSRIITHNVNKCLKTISEKGVDYQGGKVVSNQRRFIIVSTKTFSKMTIRRIEPEIYCHSVLTKSFLQGDMWSSWQTNLQKQSIISQWTIPYYLFLKPVIFFLFFQYQKW